MLDDLAALKRAFSAGYLTAVHRLRAMQRQRECDYADLIDELEQQCEAAVKKAEWALEDERKTGT